ncbi:MAG TPA: glycosyltransferase, partial [Bryobacteraceae bacterium]|nr:glycosyltransferase [Bryobacteraceae bacterium]
LDTFRCLFDTGTRAPVLRTIAGHVLRGFSKAARVVCVSATTRQELTAVYRRAALVLQPSDREGFGLPVIEAMACGTPVLATDLPVFREVAGDFASYCPGDNVAIWTAAAAQLLHRREQAWEEWEQLRASCRKHARRFSWGAHARALTEIYRSLSTTPHLTTMTEMQTEQEPRPAAVGSGQASTHLQKQANAK